MESESRHCRLCFGEDVKEHSLFQLVDENGVFLSTKIILCTSLMITKEDLYSEYICNNCLEMIELFYEFRNTCLKTHISMYNMLNDTSQIKYDNIENNCGKNDSLNAVTEVEIFSESNNQVHVDEGSENNEIHENNYFNKLSDKSEMNHQIDDNVEDTCRQFQVGCYVPILAAESSHSNGDITSLHRRFKCIECKNVYASLRELDSHWDLCENNKEESAMNILNQNVICNVQSNISYHENSVIVTKREGQSLEKEEYKHKNRSNGKEFCCESCGQVFKQLLLLKRHIQVKHVCVRPYNCPHCPRNFFDKYELKYHQRLHQDIEDFCCSICKRRFARRSGLKAHMRSHTGEKPFECKICNKGFAHLNSLIAHERVHTGERPYLCNYCPRTFAQYSTAKSHEEMHMGGMRMFQCGICDRMFRTDLEMTTHRTTHEGSHEYNCMLCNRTFKKQSDLNKHNQRYHCEDKPYPCNQCSKSYVTMRELQLHSTLHTGELPYTCLLCSKSYRRSATLRRHTYKHHTSPGDVSYKSTFTVNYEGIDNIS